MKKNNVKQIKINKVKEIKIKDENRLIFEMIHFDRNFIIFKNGNWMTEDFYYNKLIQNKEFISKLNNCSPEDFDESNIIYVSKRKENFGLKSLSETVFKEVEYIHDLLNGTVEVEEQEQVKDIEEIELQNPAESILSMNESDDNIISEQSNSSMALKSSGLMKNIELLLNVKKSKNVKVSEVLLSHKLFINLGLNLNEVQEQVNSILGYNDAEVVITNSVGGTLKSADLKVI